VTYEPSLEIGKRLLPMRYVSLASYVLKSALTYDTCLASYVLKSYVLKYAVASLLKSVFMGIKTGIDTSREPATCSGSKASKASKHRHV